MRAGMPGGERTRGAGSLGGWVAGDAEMRTRQTVPKAGAGVPGARCAPLPPSALSSARAPRWGADPCCPTRVAETPGRRVAEDREAEREKKSPPGTPERRPATPSSPSFSSSHHRPADPGQQGKEAAGAGAGPSARVSAPRPAAGGPRGPSRAGSGRAARGGGGVSGVWAAGHPSARVPRRVLTRRRRKADLPRPRRRRPRRPRREVPYKAAALPARQTLAALFRECAEVGGGPGTDRRRTPLPG